MLHRGFKPAKCKTALNLAKSRIKLMKNRKDIQLKQLRREVAQLLDSGQDQTARIRVEHVIREEKMIAAYEMIEIYCELVVARLPIIESQKNCPLDLKEAIASLIFAAPRCGDITELQDVRKHFTAKYGKEFASAAAEVRPSCGVSRTLVEKLSVNAPDGQTKVKILTAIAEEHNIKWEPNWFKEEDPLPSVDIPKVAVAQSAEGSKIQMQPLNYELADDLEENHSRDKARPATSSQSRAHTHSDLVPPSSTPHLDPRPSECSSEKMKFSQSSGTAKSTFGTGRQNWNMEFKDATAAAQAAAESAEMASFAARAAAELASRSNVMSDDHHHRAGSGLQQNHVHRNSTSGSFNQKSPRIRNQEDSYRQGNMTEGGDATSLNIDYTQYGGQYETEKQDFTERKNSRTRDPDSTPITYKPEDEYEIESSESPFREETVERKNHSRSFQSQSSVFEDEYGVFSNLNDDNKHDSGDGYLGSFSRKTDDQEVWHARSAYTFDEEDTTFKDYRDGNRILESNHREENILDSGNDIFVGIDHRTSSMGLDEKEIHTNSEVFFDESGSDDDDKSVLNSTEEHKFHAPSEPTRIGSSLNQDNRHFEPDLSESFRRSPMYSKLTEPMSLNFDDSDGASSGCEEELQKEKFDPGVPSYDNQMPGADPHLELRLSNVEKGTTDYSMSSKHMEEKQYSGFSESSYGNSSAALSTGFKSRSDDDVSYEGGPQKSSQSLRHSESRHPGSEFEYETQPTPDGGMGLNLGLLPGGRRNRAHGRMPKGRLADASSPSRSTDAFLSNTFGSSEKASTYEYQSSSSQIDNKQVPMKMSGLHTNYDSPSDDNEKIITRKDADRAEEAYKARSTIDGNTSKSSLKGSPRYFDSDDSSSEEDVPKPVVSKTFLGAGLSRRTKTSAPRTAARSNASDTAKTGQSSSSYNTELSSSRIIGQSSQYDDYDDQNLAAKSSKDVITSSSSVLEKPVTPKRPDVPETSNFNEKAPSRENSTKNPSHVHPKLPDFETITAQLHSLRRNR